jgi:hypothetical protein
VRKHGLTVDNLLAADILTADGKLLRADADSHPAYSGALRVSMSISAGTPQELDLYPLVEAHECPASSSSAART